MLAALAPGGSGVGIIRIFEADSFFMVYRHSAGDAFCLVTRDKLSRRWSSPSEWR